MTWFDISAFMALFVSILVIAVYFIHRCLRLDRYTRKVCDDIAYANDLIDYKEDHMRNFYRDYETVNEKLDSVPSLSHVWQEFIEHIVFDKNADGELVVKNSIQPSAYFNKDNLLTQSSDFNQRNSIAWDLIIFGALGMFIVFSVSVVGVVHSPAESVSILIIKLIKGTGLSLISFTTGLAFAMVFAKIAIFETARVENRLREFTDNLEKALKFFTNTQVDYEIRDILREYSKKFDGFSNNFAIGSYGGEQHKLDTDALKDTLENLSDNLQQAITQSVTSLSENLTSANSANFMESHNIQTCMHTEIQKISDTQTECAENLRKLDSISKSVEGLLYVLENSQNGDEVTNHIDEQTRVFSAFGNSLPDSLKGVLRKVFDEYMQCFIHNLNNLVHNNNEELRKKLSEIVETNNRYFAEHIQNSLKNIRDEQPYYEIKGILKKPQYETNAPAEVESDLSHNNIIKFG